LGFAATTVRAGRRQGEFLRPAAGARAPLPGGTRPDAQPPRRELFRPRPAAPCRRCFEWVPPGVGLTALPSHAPALVPGRQTFHSRGGDRVELAGNGLLGAARADRDPKRTLGRLPVQNREDEARGEAVPAADPIDETQDVPRSSMEPPGRAVVQKRTPAVFA